MTNIFFFLSTKHIVSHKIHKINIYFFFFWQKDKAKKGQKLRKRSRNTGVEFVQESVLLRIFYALNSFSFL